MNNAWAILASAIVLPLGTWALWSIDNPLILAALLVFMFALYRRI